MKRDLELVRGILLDVESDESGTPFNGFSFEGKTDREIAEHVALLAEAGYLDASIVEDEMGMPSAFVVRRLTWQGHEFLANAKNESVWNKVKNQVGDKATTISMTVMNALLAKATKEFFGLTGPD